MPNPVNIQGLQEAQRANLRRIAALKPDSHFGSAVKNVTAGLHRYAVTITHVWHIKGGALRASQRMSVKGIHGRIYIDRSSVNPRGGRPSIYGPYEEARGGEHAFYSRTVDEAGDKFVGLELGKLGRRLL